MSDTNNNNNNSNESTVVVPENRVLTGSNFNDFETCKVADHNVIAKATQRQDLDLKTSFGFLVHGMMTPEECNEEIEGVRPYGFDQDGIWIPLELDNCFSFGRYEPGGRFKPHLDATYAENPDKRSIYTMQIYLNDDYTGGNTNFYLMADPLKPDTHVLTESVKPRLGSAVIFNHDTLHEGAEVETGVKYIIRVDMMFIRIDKGAEMSSAQLADLAKARELFFRADDLEKDVGDLESAISTYVQAQMLLAKFPSVVPDPVVPVTKVHEP
eukprot:gene22389-26858_t